MYKYFYIYLLMNKKMNDNMKWTKHLVLFLLVPDQLCVFLSLICLK